MSRALPALSWRTPRAWAEAALEEPLALLSDHAHCELGAAATAQSLLARHAGERELVERLSAHALEELRHFRSVHRLLLELGGSLRPVRRNEYVEGLLARRERGARLLGRRERGALGGLLDRLLISALIERRSLERFELLLEVARERASALAPLYAELVPSESGHARLFLDLARSLFADDQVEARLRGWLASESEILRALPFAPAVHSGPPAPRADSLPAR